jgi:uncharacterized membrane protein
MVKLLEIFDPIAIGISFMGMIIMLWGIIVCFTRFFHLEWHKRTTHQTIKERENIRVQLGTYLLLGLEFLIAADILHSAHHPQLESLYVLGLIVLIRTVISFFLNRELTNRHQTLESKETNNAGFTNEA